jgi:head-tail adaptor
MAPLSAGARDRLVTIQQLTESKGASNYPVETWSALTQVWAAKKDAKGVERFVHSVDQHSAPYDTTWELPYSVNWDPELVNVPKTRRLVVKGRVHDIVAANEVDRKRGVEIMTLAGGLLE